MASPIGNLIHPPDSSRTNPLPHSYGQGPSHPPHLFHQHPHLHPQIYPSPLGAAVNSASSISLAPLITTPSAAGHPNGNVQTPVSASAAPTTPQSAGSAFPRGHSSTQSLYQCADCLRRYSRPEHLQRHIATHTLGKRFSCDICSKAFSRADLLKRHRTNHQDDNGTKRRRISSSPGVGRVAHACQACAKARVKCEEMKPCTRCKTRGIDCDYPSSEDVALHLLHLSSDVRPSSYSQETSPESSYPPPPLPPPPPQVHSQFPPAPPNLPLIPYPSHPDPQVVNQNPILQAHPPVNEEAQLPTPETLMDQSNPDSFQPPYPPNDMVDVARLPFSDFLRDVLYDQSLSNPARLAEAQGLAVLDFCDNTSLDLKDLDFGLLDNWNPEQLPDHNLTPLNPNIHPSQQQQQRPINVDITAMRSNLVKIWTESPWRWSPGKADTCYTEQSNLPLNKTTIEEGITSPVDRLITEKLHSSSRDKILGIVLSTCQNNSTMTRVASSFPSTDTMDSWIHIFLASHLCSVSAWIHYGSFSLNSKWPEWLAMAAAAGAVLAPISALRRFGFALQEAVRVTIPNRFEENNTKIADIVPVQALVMVQDVGLWSGNRRKMEIAECHLTIPIAMMRYRGKFQRSSYPSVVVGREDEGKVLEDKWRVWSELESWKRLVFHTYLRDAQVSMTQLCNPSMSYAELTLPLPCSKELWFSRTAEEFKMRYLEVAAGEGGGKCPPSLGDLLRDISLLSTNHPRVDVQYAISIYLHGFWSLIWEYRQLKVVYRSTDDDTNHDPNLPLLTSRHQELCRILQNFQLVTHDWHEMLSAQESIVLHLLLMNLHVSLDDLQLFSGKEGEEQARRVYPVLQRWSVSFKARQALWHAGQILRQAKCFPSDHLKDFWAVSVHHAALCVWTHGVVVGAGVGGGGGMRESGRGDGGSGEGGVVYLDGEEGSVVHRWVSFGEGRAAIRGVGGMETCLVGDSRGCMEVVQEILRANFGNESGSGSLLPAVSENIVVLLRRLGEAASAVGLG